MAQASTLPQPTKKHFLFKHAYYFAKEPLKFIEDNFNIGPVYRVLTPNVPVITVNHPDLVKYIMQENNRNFTKSFAYDKIRNFMGNGLFTSYGDFWLRQRRLAQPAFYKERILNISTIMVECIDRMLDRWDATPDGQIDISYEMNALALDVVTQTLFSSDIGQEVDVVNRSVTEAIENAQGRVQKPISAPLWFPTAGNLREKRALRNLDRIVYGFIEARRKSTERYDDLLGMLMDSVDEETGEQMNDLQLRDEVMTLFIAGHETTANSLAFIFYTLVNRPDILEKCITEVDNATQGQPCNGNHARGLVYIKAVIDEALRLYPPLWILGRRNIEDETLGGYAIPKGTNILIPVICLHRSPEFWDKPLEFIPERFLPENVGKLHKFTYFPFGGGPRLCLGNNFALMEMMIAIGRTLQRFTLHKPANMPTIEVDPTLTLRPKQAVIINVSKRVNPNNN